MKIEVKKTILQALLEKAATVMSCKDITPIVRNFLLDAKDGVLNIIATDLSLSVIAKTTLVRADDGRVVMPRTFLDIVKEAADEVMVIDADNNQAKISCGPTNWVIKIMNATEYPDIPTSSDIDMQVDRDKLLYSLQKVRPAVSASESRPALRIVDIKGDRVRASDGSRLHQVVINGLNMTCQIPASAVDDLIKLLKSADTADVKEIGFGTTEQLLVFRIHHDIFIINRTVYEFPDVDSTILKSIEENDQVLRVNRIALRDAIKRCRITADTDSNQMAIVLDENRMVIGCQDKYQNAGSQGIDVHWPYDKQELVVNHNYLFDMVSASDKADCEFHIGKDKGRRRAPIALKEDNTVCVLLQLRAKEAANAATQTPAPAGQAA